MEDYKIKFWVIGYHCLRCKHEWLPRREIKPKVCPLCKSPYWYKPIKNLNSSLANKKK